MTYPPPSSQQPSPQQPSPQPPMSSVAATAVAVAVADVDASAPRPFTTPHSSWVWPTRIVGVLFVGLIVALGTTSVITEFFVREQATTRTFTEPVSAVDASVDIGGITVTAGSTPNLTQVSAVAQSAFRTADVRMDLVDGLLTMTGKCGARWFVDSRCAVDLDVVIPPGTTLRLNSGTGDIVVVGADRDVTVRTATGDLRLTDLRSGSVDAEAATGDVELRFVAPPTSVRASTATGSVVVRVPADGTTYRIESQTDVGQAKIGIPNDASSPRLIDVTSAVGDVTVSAVAAS